MSFFPSADPNEEQILHASSQYFFQTQTPSSSAQVPSVPLGWNLSYGTTPHGLPSSQPTTWASAFEQPHCLGLQGPTDCFASFYMGTNLLSQPAAATFTWPVDFTPTQTPIASARAFRRDSCGDNCDTPPTVQPSQLWEPFQSTTSSTGPQQPSPGQSEYSTSSYQSTTSSPFVHSEAYLQHAGSPLTKVEAEPVSYGSPMRQGVPPMEPSRAHSTRNLIAPSEAPPAQHLSPAYACRPASDAGDVKPSLRPGYRRAYSAADTEELHHPGRRKRSLTRPENASCSCGICGKLFQRWYNLKAHMETHDADRSAPHKCKHAGCGKRFVRRTDLVRHNQSVHLRARPFACSRCHNAFARKDTLQRHVEDGCAMRPEMKRRPARSARSRAAPPVKQESSSPRAAEDIQRLPRS